MKKRSGIKLLEEQIGEGEQVIRQRFYRLSLRAWMRKGDPIRWTKPFGTLSGMVLSEDMRVMTADYRFDRVYLIAGLYYGLEGMRIGGKRLIEISPHLAFRENGCEGMVPANAVVKVEVTVLEYSQRNRAR